MQSESLNIPSGKPRVIGFVVAPSIVYDDGVNLRQGPPISPIQIGPDELYLFAQNWESIFADFVNSIEVATNE